MTATRIGAVVVPAVPSPAAGTTRPAGSPRPPAPPPALASP